jgi:hypothetical protein
MVPVQRADEVARRLVRRRRKDRRPREIPERLGGVEIGALKRRRQKPRPPKIARRLRRAARIGDRDVSRKRVVLAPQRIRRPRADAGKSIKREAGGEEVFARTVRVPCRLISSGL